MAKPNALVVNKKYMEHLLETGVQHAYYLPLALPIDKGHC